MKSILEIKTAGDIDTYVVSFRVQEIRFRSSKIYRQRFRQMEENGIILRLECSSVVHVVVRDDQWRWTFPLRASDSLPFSEKASGCGYDIVCRFVAQAILL